MDNHTQYSGFAGVDLAKKVMQIHFVTGDGEITDKQVKSLADLPSLPVMRAMLLGVISAPATKLVRTLAEPARSMAAVVKAYSEKAPVAG